MKISQHAAAWLLGGLVCCFAGSASAQFAQTTAGGGPGPNFPQNERPELAIDNDIATKYLNFGAPEVVTGLVITPTTPLTTVTGLRITTANDAPARDPLTFILEGSLLPNPGPNGLFVPIFTGSTGLETDPGRRVQGPIISFANLLPYSAYRLTFPTVRTPTGAGSANSLQLAELELLANGTDITTGAAVIGIHQIPEPASLGLGLAAVGLLARRRK